MIIKCTILSNGQVVTISGEGKTLKRYTGGLPVLHNLIGDIRNADIKYPNKIHQHDFRIGIWNEYIECHLKSVPIEHIENMLQWIKKK